MNSTGTSLVEHRPSAQVALLDPLRDPRWSEFVEWHPNASVFHSTGWLQALRRTYGYEPLVVTTAAKDEPLRNGLVFCRVRSFATGSRLVSLPFSDHCDPLVDDPHDMQSLIAFLKAEVKHGRYRYLELRPLSSWNASILQEMPLTMEGARYSHKLDLSPTLDELYQTFHRKSVRHMIKKAEQAHLHYEEGRSEELLSKFYKLVLMTRRRHQLPPQSTAWFRNLMDCLGANLKVRLVSKDKQPIAGAITAHFRDTGVYKYGCSDAQHHKLGGTVLLIWHAIQDAKAAGARFFDFGRSDHDNKGLVTFKDHWGATRSTLPYFRFAPKVNKDSHADLKMWIVRKSCAYLPDPLFKALGSVLYEHVG